MKTKEKIETRIELLTILKEEYERDLKECEMQFENGVHTLAAAQLAHDSISLNKNIIESLKKQINELKWVLKD